MLDQKVTLGPLIRGDEGVENEAGERIVDLGDPRQGRRSAVGGDHRTERGDGVWRVGQPQGRAVDGAHVETVPAPDRESTRNRGRLLRLGERGVDPDHRWRVWPDRRW